MNLKSRKNALLFSGLCLTFLAGGAPCASAATTDGVQAVQQTRKITGTVVDQSGEAIIGANVMVKGTTNGTITDFDGKFSLDASAGQELVVSYIGYVTQTVAATNGMTIILKEDAQSLEEVVVVGYGVQKKKLVTGATVQVKGDDIAKLNTTQALGALQSQTPGVNIQAVSGQPGEGFKVTIRGAGTNGNTTPLYVIDGVAGGNINSINPADIESIDVLKDAASCAIYGSAAANGVILVTTKQGKDGKLQVSYDGNIGWQNIYRLPKMLTAKQYMQAQDLINVNSGLDPWNWASYFKGYEDLYQAYLNGSNPGTNWVDAIRNKNAVTTSHSLNLTGGNDKSKYSVGLGYQYQDGIIGGEAAPTDFSRFTIRINSEHVLLKSQKGFDVIKLGENLYYRHEAKEGIDNGNQYSNPLSDALRAAPIVPIYNKDGGFFALKDFQESGLFNYNQYLTNPYYALMNSQSGNNESRSYGLNAVGYIEIQPIKGLIYRGQVSYNQSSWSWRAFYPEYAINNQGAFNTNPRAVNQVGLGWGWNTTNTLNYRFDVAKHNFDFLVGTEYGQSNPNYGMSLSATASNPTVGDLMHAYMNNMKNNTQANVSGSPYGYTKGMSYFGRLNYNFNERYMFSAIFRADGSSVFAPGHRWGYFPSFSAGWVVTEESFMEPVKNVMDYLKLRAGWGQNGNKNINAFAYEAAFAYDAYSNYSFGNTNDVPVSGASLSRLANEDLTWETSEQLNVGLDARFLGSRLGVNVDWYKKTTKDLLLYVPVSPTTGFSTTLKNAGTVQNTGLEVSLSWNDQISKDFSYNVGWNMALNKNKVTAVNSPQKYNNGAGSALSQGTDFVGRFEEGQPIGYFYGYKTLGVIQNTNDLENYIKTQCGGNPLNSRQGADLKVGDLMFADYNGDGVINDGDKTYLGDPHPDVTMGLNLGFNYKGFDFNLTGYAALGQQVARAGYRRFYDSGQDNFTTEIFDYWMGEGTSNKYPQLALMNTGANWGTISDIYVENAGYFRLQNITLGYDFTKIWKSAPFQQLRLYFAAQNLFTLTGYKGMDPENGKSITGNAWETGIDVGNYPQPRTYMVGVNVKF
ncbi:MAG: TonB-dependent receptor [Bacteroidaceae bacterium]|nr:TonB-dependent receptor [Bacteroidaceae bacterium]